MKIHDGPVVLTNYWLNAAALTAVNQVICRSRNLPGATPNATAGLPATTTRETLHSRIELNKPTRF